MAITELRNLSDPAVTKRLVIKVGSALLVGSDGKPRHEWLTGLVAEIAEMRAAGQHIVVVSSGAIALGAARMGLGKSGRGSLADAQAAASVGQIALAGLWSQLLEQHGLHAAQMLVTLGDLEDRRRYLNASSTLGRLLEAGIVPVVNENDSVATEEIRFGDNDRLAARVAQAAGADAVMLLSDVDGLYDRNPSDAAARMLPVVDGVTDAIRAMADGGSSSGLGSGGMTSKLQAAEIAERGGIALAIINGTREYPIRSAVDAGVGTLFLPQRKDAGRKAWLGGRIDLRGSVTVDSGCQTALIKGSSLLAAGITKVEGDFARGDAIAVCDPAGRQLAQGLVEYSSDECRVIKGLRADAQAEPLGYAPRPAVIHRDHLVLL